MKKTGIIMSGKHPRLTLDGLKTMTRRTWGLEEINIAPWCWELSMQNEQGLWVFTSKHGHGEHIVIRCPYGQAGDFLIIKETWATEKRYDHLKPSDVPPEAKIYYVEKLTYAAGGYSFFGEMGKMRPSMFMCQRMSRANPVITAVRAERLQEITNEDAKAEGVIPMTCCLPGAAHYITPFKELWDSLNAKRGYPFDFNPWVWPISFSNIPKNN